ncbi:MAG: 1-acyl-sn-glycerol-3-phosphate acyltransferase [Candidatus Cryptobacteroides sp.]|jgi:hypothetical protein|nr:hypothetical protein [Rikenellaceae bacterium]
MSDEEFSNISPYTDEEAVAALKRLSHHPMLPFISKYLFPKERVNLLAKALRKVESIDDFQQTVMSKVVSAVVDSTSAGFTYDGIENIKGDRKFLAISNHRDIILDPALTQWTFFNEGLPMTQICVGSNLLSSRTFEDLLRSNRMIKVIRGISARELYLCSQHLSRYIRHTITSGTASVWIAQREGRTKNGLDVSEQGILKMFDLSGTGDFKNNFQELNMIPMSISYEYEPCDARKARELLIKRETGSYTKKPNEDMHSILTGIRQWKGGIHLSIGKPITELEIIRASWYEKNDRYQAIRRTIDRRIIAGYKLWKTNYMGYDLMTGTDRFAEMYTPEDLENFKAYTEHKLGKLERRLDRDALRVIFWHIYGNPVLAKIESV